MAITYKNKPPKPEAEAPTSNPAEEPVESSADKEGPGRVSFDTGTWARIGKAADKRLVPRSAWVKYVISLALEDIERA